MEEKSKTIALRKIIFADPNLNWVIICSSATFDLWWNYQFLSSFKSINHFFFKSWFTFWSSLKFYLLMFLPLKDEFKIFSNNILCIIVLFDRDLHSRGPINSFVRVNIIIFHNVRDWLGHVYFEKIIESYQILSYRIFHNISNCLNDFLEVSSVSKSNIASIKAVFWVFANISKAYT